MRNKRLFIEQRSAHEYAVLRPNADRASAILPTQAEAIARAREIEPTTRPDVERVRHTVAGQPDQWRKA